MPVIDFEISDPAIFTTLGGMRSGPVAFLGYRDLIILVTSFSYALM